MEDRFCPRHGRASRPIEVPGLRCDCPVYENSRLWVVSCGAMLRFEMADYWNQLPIKKVRELHGWIADRLSLGYDTVLIDLASNLPLTLAEAEELHDRIADWLDSFAENA